MVDPKNIIRPVTIFLKGLFMGSADIIPGVSGGTIAFITGIYDDFVNALRSIQFHFLIFLLRSLADTSNLQKAKKSFLSIHFSFLIPLVFGIAVAFVGLAHMIGFFLENHATYTYGFFFGLISASAGYVFLSNKNEFNLKTILFSILGLVIGYLLVGFQSIHMDHSLPILFFSGCISFLAMILPGISGAFILLLIGQYDFLLSVLRGLTRFQWENMPFAVAYLLGGVVGLLVFSRFLGYLLQKHRGVTLGFILGLMIGSLRKPFMFIWSDPQHGFITIFSICLGFVIVSMFSYYEFIYKKDVQKTSVY